MTIKSSTLIIGVVLLFIVSISFGLLIWMGLKPCGWLDGTLTKQSGCIQVLNRAYSVIDIVFSPDGTEVATSSFGSQIQLWNLTSNEYHIVDDREGVNRIDISPDGNTLAISYWHTVQLRRINDGKLVRIFDSHTGKMEDVDFSPDGTILAVGVLDYQVNKGDHKIHLWRVSDGILLHTLRGHTGYVNAVEFSPNSEILASASNDGVRLWQVNDGTLLSILNSNEEARDVTFSPDGTLLASTGYNTVNLWQTDDGSLLRTLAGHNGLVYSVAFSPDGSILAASGNDGTVRLWRTNDGNLLHTLKLGLANHARIYDVNFSPNGAILVTSQSNGTVKLFDVQKLLKQ